MANYVTETEANTYIDPNPLVGSKWQAFTIVQRQTYIDYVQIWVDNLDWLGDKEVGAQAEQFPRINVLSDAKLYESYERTSYDIQDRLTPAESVIPPEIQNAVFETIIFVLRTGQFDKLVAMQEINIEELTAGSVEFVFREEDTPYPLPVNAFRLVYWLHRTWWKRGNSSILGRI